MTGDIVRDCPVCGSPAERALSLPGYPLTEILLVAGEERGDVTRDQFVATCCTCSHTFLEVMLDPILLYGDSYLTKSAASGAAIAAIDRFIGFVTNNVELSSFGAIIDVGANDFSMLTQLADRGYRGTLIGVDPVLDEPPDNVVGIRAFGEEVDFEPLGARDSPRLFLSSHTLEHLTNPGALVSRITEGMRDGDIFVLQTPSIEAILLERRFDQVHHQHMHYYSYESLTRLMSDGGLEVTASEIDWLHYGAWLIVARKGAAEPVQLGPRLARLKKSLTVDGLSMAETVTARYNEFKAHVDLVDRQLSAAEYVAFGGALMLPILAYHFPSMWTECVAVLDDSPERYGWHFASTPLPISPASGATIAGQDCLVTGAVSKTAGRQIVRRLTALKVKNIYFPTPGF